MTVKNNPPVFGLMLAVIATLLTACRPANPSPQDSCSPGAYDEEIISGGQSRQYRLHIPPSYKPDSPIPLLLGFHGAGSTAAVFENYSSFSALADQVGIIAVYPQGIGDLTNWDTYPNSPDVVFINDLLDSLEARCNIDPTRIFASGHSRGGGMVNRLGCDLADRLAAIGPVSGDYEKSADCTPSQPIAVIAFHGTADPYIPYNGFGLPGQMRESYTRIGVPITSWAAGWAERNGCDKTFSTIPQPSPVTAQSWQNCSQGSEVRLYTIQGGTHDWPTAIDAAATMWEFFTAHPLPSN